jgi:hypothetical protein
MSGYQHFYVKNFSSKVRYPMESIQFFYTSGRTSRTDKNEPGLQRVQQNSSTSPTKIRLYKIAAWL